MKQIIPSLIANSQKELELQFNKVKKHFKTFHLDIMDGKFVKNKSLLFDFVLPKRKYKYEVHLMVKNPKKWIEENSKKSNLIIFHIESVKSEKEARAIIKLIKSKKKKVGIAINPKTNANKIIPYLKIIDRILIMTVNPGKYGAKFIPNTLKKVKEIKKINSKINIELDGGINEKSIFQAKNSGANYFSIGSYLQKSKDMKKSIESLK